MLDRKTIERLGGWEGYRVERVVWPEGESRTVTIYLKPSARTMHCEHCGNRCRQVHETTTRRVRDLPLMALRVTLVVPRRRVWCEQVRWTASGEAELAGPLPASDRPAGRGDLLPVISTKSM
ncbi:helix-turn-helix domain of transposase ISL3 family protein [Bordetella holmesii 41130]|nr:helix-turn-helix domain of transposase ISL3 family protein [Bordetella holmesii 41130]